MPGPRQDDVPGVGRLRVQLVAGSLDLGTHDAEHVRVEVLEVSGNPLELTQDGDALTVGYPFLGWDGWWKRLMSYRSRDRARLRVRVPRHVRVSVGTAVAEVTAVGLQEDVALVTAGGRLTLTGSRGAADLKTASGPVDVTDHDGPVRVGSASGRVHVDGAVPRVEVMTAAGAVTVRTTTPTSVVDLSTVSGAMTVRLPHGAGVSLTARTVTGAVRLDGTDRRTAAPGTTTLEDRPGDQVCWLTTRSVSGGLTVVRHDAGAVDVR